MARLLDAPGGPGPLAAPAYLTPQERVALERAPKRFDRKRALENRAGRWWDVPAKYNFAKEVYDEERTRWAGHSNDAGDAMRHAVASQRIADAAGPVFAEAAGLGHEIVNLRRSLLEHGPGGPYDRSRNPTPGQTFDEMRMDLHNNDEGRRAAREHRPIEAQRLQTLPTTPTYAPLYRSPHASLEGLPRR